MGHAAHTGQKRKMYRVLVEELKERTVLKT
jgi:hypothetical protein